MIFQLWPNLVNAHRMYLYAAPLLDLYNQCVTHGECCHKWWAMKLDEHVECFRQDPLSGNAGNSLSHPHTLFSHKSNLIHPYYPIARITLWYIHIKIHCLVVPLIITIIHNGSCDPHCLLVCRYWKRYHIPRSSTALSSPITKSCSCHQPWSFSFNVDDSISSHDKIKHPRYPICMYISLNRVPAQLFTLIFSWCLLQGFSRSHRCVQLF